MASSVALARKGAFASVVLKVLRAPPMAAPASVFIGPGLIAFNADALRAEIVGEIPHRGFQRRLWPRP